MKTAGAGARLPAKLLLLPTAPQCFGKAVDGSPVPECSARGGAASPGEVLMLRFTSERCLMAPRRSNASYIYKKLEFPASSVVQFQMLFGLRRRSLISSQLGPCVSVKAESFRALGS